jgi:O-acetyl-ADP-ribose deacetylase (regulator of RNase III)
MIETRKGSLLDATGIIVHGCNCQGVMGSGVALAIKKALHVARKVIERKERDGL